MEFTENIREWVSVDNRIKKYQEAIKKERSLKSTLAASILAHAGENNMENTVIEITDGKLKFQNTRVTAPLTFRFLEECLKECINGDEQVAQIIKYVKSKRGVKIVQDIKRTYAKTV